MAKKKTAKKKTPMKKKVAKKNTTLSLPPNSGLWFFKDFTEGSGSDPIGRKRKLIEAFFEGWLHSYNESGQGQNVYNILTQQNDGFDGFQWSVRQGKQHVEVYVKPIPIPAVPGGATSDPPPPTSPPPKMT